MVEKPDHERIWLEPECCADTFNGRTWCQDNVWPSDDCPHNAKATEYVRADLATRPTDEVEKLREENRELREIVAELGYCTPDASLEFMRLIPAEIKAAKSA